MFSGISPEAMWLLADNRFRDSKTFYDEHKLEIRRQVIEPMRELLAEVAPVVQEIDPEILANPGRNNSISRVRRDNRYSRDKSMYRENMWVVWARDKNVWENAPGFYIDFSLRGAEYGMGFYSAPPRLMKGIREALLAAPDCFLEAAGAAADAGFIVEGDRYARPKLEGLPPLLDDIANRKSLTFLRREPDPAFFGDSLLTGTLKEGFLALAPIYRLLLQCSIGFSQAAEA